MYNFLKSVAKNMLPKKVLIENEENFRKLLMPLYTGKDHECNVCGTRLKKFAALKNGDLICPVCGALPRARRLYILLESEFLKPNISVLDFSPLRILYRKFKKRKDITYFGSDFEGHFLSDYHYDITDIENRSDAFDLIICYHILEHIIEDRQAMTELYRVLKNDGVVLIQTPFKEGEVYEDYTITTQEERTKHFGQHDHVRIYSAQELENRLKEAGFNTEIRTFKGDDYYGLTDQEKVIICRK
ncbi:class I SAM-dependent methyltransferase [Chryseobacterium sp.]|uniref:class I SAM-dependent methyltransferase n=1 Tax=Chryseobacterium sp. TaxID=1871047 RepID=UPI0025BDA755|nr:class I SAM-dependent methyltransferase [Chryseobacterium sp.]